MLFRSPRSGKELLESEEVYRMGGDEYYKDIDEEITGGVGSLEEWIKMKRGYKGGGEVNLTVIEIPDISQSGVESLFKRR